MTSRWILLGVPWDCSASDRGEADAPAGLRRARIRELADVDLGHIPIEIRTARRDPETGVLALADTIRAAHRLADDLAAAMAEHPVLVNRPIVQTPKGAALCRPSEKVFDLLDRVPDVFTKEDGEVVRPKG